MQISALLEDLHCLKRDIEIVIEQAESIKDEYVNPDIKNHVVICKKQLSSIHELINDSNIERELSDKKKKTNNSNIKRELTDDKKEKSKADNNSPPDNQSHQSDVDDLDDLNFDEFVLETTSSEDVKNLPQLTSKNQMVDTDCPSDLDDEEEMRIQKEMAQELSNQSTDNRVHETFDDSDFDAEDLGMIDEAERSAVDEPTQLIEDEPDDIDQPDDPRYQEVLKEYFGFSKFRPFQWKIINSVLNDKRDNCVIMATGYGKSLTFQFPSVYTKGVSVIISPLISLMQDQVHNLKASNIEACFLGSAQESMGEVKEAMFQGKYRIVYVTPEYASTAVDQLKKLNQNVGLDLIAIDEAHCVSQWGHDFRASYRQLGMLKSNFPKVPVLAVTATATVEVRNDICRSLKLNNPNMTCTGFDRPNLFLSVSPKTGDIANDLKMEMTRTGHKFTFDGPTIVYCPTKKATEDVTSALKGLNIACLPYHASLSLTARKKAHNSFINDQIQVVVATVAFGMGIDKPDVRKVIHYGAPKDIESYYQEIGRAGRDGMPSECIAIFSRTDFNTSRHFISEINNEKFREHKLKMLSKMEQYLATTSCRRRILLSYFESGNLNEIGGTENCCDCCRLSLMRLRHGLTTSNSEDGPKDYTREAGDLFKAIQYTANRFGLGVPCQVLMGSNSKKVQQFQSSKVFGSGKYKSLKFWTALGRSLVYEGYLREKSLQNGYGCTVEMTPKAESWYSKIKQGKAIESPLYLTPSGDLLQEEQAQKAKAVSISVKPPPTVSHRISLSEFAAPSATTSAAASHAQKSAPSVPPVDEKTAKLQTELYGKLLKTRSDLAQETGFTPHNIASNKVLRYMAEFRPVDKSSLLKIEDFPQVKVDRHGDVFVKLIKLFCDQNSLEVNKFPVFNSDVCGDSNEDLKAELMKITETQRQTYIMVVLHGKRVEEVASQRGIKTSTVITHLSEALKAGLSVDIRKLGVPLQMERMISDAVWAPPVNGGTSSLTKIKDQLPSYIEYNHIKLVVSNLIARHGQEVTNNGDLKLIGNPTQSKNETPKPVTDVDVFDDAETGNVAEDVIPQSSRKRGYNFCASDDTSPPLRKSLTEPHDRSNPSVSCGSPGTGDSQRFSQSQSIGSDSQSDNIFSQNQPRSQSSAKKSHAWMSSLGNKTVFKKKMKSNSLFK